MDEQTKRILEDRIEFGYEFPISTYLSEGWNIYKKFAGGFIGFFLLTLLITSVVGLIPVLGFIATTFLLNPPLSTGHYLVADKIKGGETYGFNDFFRGFDFIGPLALMTLIMVLILTVVFTPSIFVLAESGLFEWYTNILENPMDPNVASPPPIGGREVSIFALNTIPLLYLSLAYLWAPLFVVFYRAGAWEALETSRRLITKRWWTFFGLILVFIGIVLLFYLPAILVMVASPALGAILLVFIILILFLLIPAMFCILYAAFADVTRLHEAQEDSLEEHLVG